MTIAERMKEIREYRGLKQFAIANAMGVSQQAYSLLENKSGNQKIETLKRFCSVVNVDLAFLVACEIPVTDANIKLFDSSGYAFVVEDYKKLKSRLDTYEELILKVGPGITQN